MLLYSGHEKEHAPYTRGVTLMLYKEARSTLIGWESHGSRIIKAAFKTKNEKITMNVIQCYAPTHDSNDDDKDQFYERLAIEDVRTRRGADIVSDHYLVVANLKLKLRKNWKTGQTALERFNTAFLRDTDKLNEFNIAFNNRFQYFTAAVNRPILMGDFNAKVGTDNTGYEDIMGRHGLGRKKRKWKTIEDVRTKRGADIASDHHLLVAKMKSKLKKHWTMGRTISQKFNTAFLQDTKKLKIVLSNKFQAFHDLLNGEGTTMESNWKGIKEAITSTCHEVLGHKKHHHKEWITVDTLYKIQERRNKKAAINTSRTRAEKAKAQAEYTVVNKQVKRSIRTDKRKYVEDLAKMSEKAAREGNMRQLYDTTKKLSGNRRKPERPVKSKECEVITNIEEQLNRWVEHFKELLNRPAPLNPPNIEAAPTDLPINVGPPAIEEISMAIRQLKSGKTAVPDNIPTEALKADLAVTARILHILFNKIWGEEQVPTDWKEGLLL
ncbi:unnamed protein product [Schistosoma margrebowiei]|uniref:Uncharacterized protein n=1 Tax=Schistosoma margrebowiei TaxID=48269 RepID=A0A183N782_9TREM|nr:unnamed protein product [Schistosoma margrebowiei]